LHTDLWGIHGAENLWYVCWFLYSPLTEKNQGLGFNKHQGLEFNKHQGLEFNKHQGSGGILLKIFEHKYGH